MSRNYVSPSSDENCSTSSVAGHAATLKAQVARTPIYTLRWCFAASAGALWSPHACVALFRAHCNLIHILCLAANVSSSELTPRHLHWSFVEPANNFNLHPFSFSVLVQWDTDIAQSASHIFHFVINTIIDRKLYDLHRNYLIILEC